ncbi:MAG: hypothetical protein ACFFD4_17050 [Candidatus Odinarchaeota archaeon]
MTEGLTPLLHVKNVSITTENGLPIVHVQWGLDIDEAFFGAFCSAIHTFANNVLQGRVITAVDMVDMKLVFEKERGLIFAVGIDTCVSKTMARNLVQQVKERFYEWCGSCLTDTSLQESIQGLEKFQQFANYLSNDFWDGETGNMAAIVTAEAAKGLENLTKGQLKLLKVIENHPGVEADEQKLTELSGYKIRTVRRYLKVLRENGLV